MRRLAAALAGGLGRTFSSVRLILVFTGLNLGLALLAVLPLSHALARLLAPAGVPGPEPGWPAWVEAEVRVAAAVPLEQLPLQAGLAALATVLLSAFLTGGALWVLHDADGGFSLAAFGRGCGRYGPRLLRLLVLLLGCLWLLSWLVGGQLGEVIRWLQFDWPDQRGPVLLEVAYQGGFLFLFYLLTWLFDLARVRLVVDRRRSALGALLAGAGLLARHPLGVTGLFGTLALAQGAVLVAAGLVLSRLPLESALGLVAFFLLAQLAVATRFAFRLAALECARRWILSLEGGG